MNNLKPAIVYHPGEILLEELEERGITQSDFAEIINRPPKTINEIIKGKKSITPETANSIAAALDTSAEMWLGMQGEYDLYLVRQKQTNQDEVRQRAKIYSIFPIREMIKRKWLTREDIESLTQDVLSLFSVKNLTEFKKALNVEQPDVCFRKSDYGEKNENYLYVWRKLGEIKAKKINCQDFDKKGLKEFAKKIKHYSIDKDKKDVVKISAELKKLGVRLMFLPHFSKTKVDGAVFWIGKKPVILMSLRYDRIDNFYFTLLHEIGHIILHNNKTFYDQTYSSGGDEKTEQSASQQEKAANDFAQTNLVPKNIRQEFENKPITSNLLLKQSKKLNIHPGLLVGALQYDGILGYSQFRKALVKIKSNIPKEMIYD